mmetsp:Transcript_1465/g.3011  ORF Transcript_1465/g.3011 Transcript_1465/m.3011 type:complete len:332 (+) Transcript_1465:1852-2847(+)
MRLAVHQDAIWRSKVHERLQHFANLVRVSSDASGELAVAPRACAALAVAQVGVGGKPASRDERADVAPALLDRLAALAHDGPQPRARERQRGEEAARPRAHHHHSRRVTCALPRHRADRRRLIAHHDGVEGHLPPRLRLEPPRHARVDAHVDHVVPTHHARVRRGRGVPDHRCALCACTPCARLRAARRARRASARLAGVEALAHEPDVLERQLVHAETLGDGGTQRLARRERVLAAILINRCADAPQPPLDEGETRRRHALVAAAHDAVRHQTPRRGTARRVHSNPASSRQWCGGLLAWHRHGNAHRGPRPNAPLVGDHGYEGICARGVE